MCKFPYHHINFENNLQTQKFILRVEIISKGYDLNFLNLNRSHDFSIEDLEIIETETNYLQMFSQYSLSN